jgi:LysR family hydrogen peroxide-inducible transcriptional activator
MNKTEQREILRLGLIPTIAPFLLPTLLPYLKEQFPQTDFVIQEKLSGDLVEALHKGVVDLAVLAFPFETPGLQQETLAEESFYAVAQEQHFPRKKLAFQDSENENILLLAEGHCLRRHALEACQLQESESAQSFAATSLPTLLQMVSHGYGMTLLPTMAKNALALPENLAIWPFQNPAPTRAIGLCYRSGAPAHGQIEKLKPALNGYFQKHLR